MEERLTEEEEREIEGRVKGLYEAGDGQRAKESTTHIYLMHSPSRPGLPQARQGAAGGAGTIALEAD